MIVRNRPSALQLFFIVKGSIFPRIRRQILATMALSLVVVLLSRWHADWVPEPTLAPFSLDCLT